MRYVFKAALLAAVSLSISPALAQETGDDLIVTATRLRSEAERLPADVAVIDVDTARSQGVLSVADALAPVAGLGVVRSGAFGQQTSLFSGGANSNHTLVLFDGIRLNDPASPGSAYDAGQDTLGGLRRIEVVQGPMSAVFGSDAIGGVVNILPRRGGDGAFNAELDVAGGSLGAIAATAAADGTTGRFRYAITAETHLTEGHDIVPERMATHANNEDGAESSTLTGVFDADLTESFALDLLVRHREARADFDAFVFPPPSFNEQRVDDADLEIAQNDLSVGRLGASWSPGEALSLRATAGAVQQDRAERDGGVTTSAFDGERRFADLTAEWRFGDTGVLSNAGIAGGVEAQREGAEIDQGFATVAAEQDHRGAFVTAQGDIGNFTLTGAARIDDFEGFGTEATWRAGASYNTDLLRLYASYGTSFRAPTLYERFIYFGDPNLDPERGQAWELGADLRFAAFGRDDGVELGALYRSTKIEDLIDFSASFNYANIDEAKIESAEARVTLRPTSWLTARLAYVHTDARDAIADTPLLRRPQYSWRASIDVREGPFTAQLAWRNVGERSDQIYGNDGFWQGVGVTAGYDVLRASAAWDLSPSVQIRLSADNLAGETYEPANGFAGAPRTVLLGLRLRSPR